MELLRLLHSKIKELSATSAGSRMPQPRFRMCILYVDEHESVQRQLSRGRKALEHNKQVDECGEGEYVEVRETDLSVKAAKQRYRLFVEGTMAANEALKRSFAYNLINASGSIEEVEAVVMQELSYQSSLELDEATYRAPLPLISSAFPTHELGEVTYRASFLPLMSSSSPTDELDEATCRAVFCRTPTAAGIPRRYRLDSMHMRRRLSHS